MSSATKFARPLPVPGAGSRTKVPPRSQRKPAEVRKLEIAQAALELLSSQRVREFTAQAVAHRVGITDAALFRHFPTMDSIVGAVVARIEEILFQGFPPRASEPLARLGEFFRTRVEALRAHPGLSRLVFFEHLAQAAGAADLVRVREFRERSIRFVAGCLGDARKLGLLADGLEPRQATTLVVGALLATGHASAGGGGLLESDAGKVWATLDRLLRRSRPVRKPGPARREPGKRSA